MSQETLDSTTPDHTGTRSTGAGMGAAKPPVGTGLSPLVAQLVALALVALGVVAVQDLLARLGLITQTPFLDVVLDAVDGLASDDVWVLVGGIIAVVVALLLLPVVVRRRPRKTLELEARTGVRVRTRDLPKLLRGHLETVDGVTGLDLRATRRSVRVVATTVVRDERRREVAEELRRRGDEVLESLERAPKIRVKTKEASS